MAQAVDDSTTRQRKGSDETRIAALINEGVGRAPPKLAGILKALAPFIVILGNIIGLLLPYIAKVWDAVQYAYSHMPNNLLQSLLGFLMCFFGGAFPVTISAVEAWNLCGWESSKEHLKLLGDEVKIIIEESKKDDTEDLDGDGIADVKQISPQALIQRKIRLVLIKVNPEHVNAAVSGILVAWVGVCASLKVNFARVITLAATIGDQLKKPAAYVIAPGLSRVVPVEYHKWIPTAINASCKAIAMVVAWWVQQIIAAIHSSIRGGLMCARGIINFLHERGFISFNDEETYLDELIGWGLAFLGFYFQYNLSFAVPFPLSLVMWPIGVVEWALRWWIQGI